MIHRNKIQLFNNSNIQQQIIKELPKVKNTRISKSLQEVEKQVIELLEKEKNEPQEKKQIKKKL